MQDWISYFHNCMEVCVFIGYHYLAMAGICFITVNVLVQPLNGSFYK